MCMIKLCRRMSSIDSSHGRPGVGSFRRFQKPNGPSPVIVGGSDATYGDYPWVVSIQYNSAINGWGHFCGGTLYNSRYAITAAHCLESKPVQNMRVVAGAISLENDVNGQTVSIYSYVTHPDYQIARGWPNDIAIITLADLVTASYAQNAVLPPDDSNLFIQNNCFLAGWGRTSPNNSTLPSVLQKLQTPVINNAECASDLIEYDNAAIFDTHICSQSTNLDSGACEGDVGSPLTCCQSETDCTTKYVVGVTSYFATVLSECIVSEPTVHVRISKFLTWIQDNTF